MTGDPWLGHALDADGEALAESARDAMPDYTEADEPIVQAYGHALALLIRAIADANSRGPLGVPSRDVEAFTVICESLAARLRLPPTSTWDRRRSDAPPDLHPHRRADDQPDT